MSNHNYRKKTLHPNTKLHIRHLYETGSLSKSEIGKYNWLSYVMDDMKRNKRQTGKNKDLEFAIKCFFQNKLSYWLTAQRTQHKQNTLWHAKYSVPNESLHGFKARRGINMHRLSGNSAKFRPDL
jgi:hypothetical protein